MKEPPGVGHTGTTEPDVCGDCVGEEDLEALLDCSDPSDDAVGGVEEAEAETEAEGDQGDQEGGHLSGEQPAGGGQAQRLTLIRNGVKKQDRYVHRNWRTLQSNRLILVD